MRIRKRDARVEDFSSSKLIKAISKCFDEVHNTNQALVYEIANSVQSKISDNTAVETIQDLVERELVSRGMYDEAKVKEQPTQTARSILAIADTFSPEILEEACNRGLRQL